MRRLGEALAALLAMAAAGAAAPDVATPASPSFELLDLEGRRVQPLADPGPRGFVFVLTSTDCPLSNRYAPELQRLHRRFAPAGVVFRLVYPDRSQHADAIRRHLREFGYTFGALRDPEHDLVRTVRATVTPEAAVFVPGPRGPRLVYRGRIDDRYVDLGRARPAPATRDLEEVLEAIVAGQPMTTRTTPAIGCFIPDPD
jgi:hypothetical protein